MKQEPFKKVYRHIALTTQQKEDIWKQIEAASSHSPVRKKALFAPRAAVCLGALLLSGMTVLAANELSLPDRLAEAMRILTQNDSAPTQKQQDLYAQSGTVLDTEIRLEHGTLKLDAALYDQNYLLLPFRYLFDADCEEYGSLTAGTELGTNNLPESLSAYSEDTTTFMHAFRFYMAQDSTQPGQPLGSSYLVTNPVISEAGTLSGSLLICNSESRSFESGNVIELVGTASTDATDQSFAEDELITETDSVSDATTIPKADSVSDAGNITKADSVLDATTIPKADSVSDAGNITKADSALGTDERFEPYAMFTLGKALAQHEVAIRADNAAALENMGLSIDSMSLSPISLRYAGKDTQASALSVSITVVRKDGRIIENAPNGGSQRTGRTGQDDLGFSFSACVLFAEPVLPEEIAEIHIRDRFGNEVRIPFEADNAR